MRQKRSFASTQQNTFQLHVGTESRTIDAANSHNDKHINAREQNAHRNRPTAWPTRPQPGMKAGDADNHDGHGDGDDDDDDSGGRPTTVQQAQARPRSQQSSLKSCRGRCSKNSLRTPPPTWRRET
ncbi:unnamed protein product [Prorocentrum cordatum]|uniref:Uncharacterized protein n=1 Tax=Prorocentrum cordatum TaxID=2364126 RepID=A0ABN9R5G6_9DINO|nr:unnamed protein product [Polarella glacialis]